MRALHSPLKRWHETYYPLGWRYYNVHTHELKLGNGSSVQQQKENKHIHSIHNTIRTCQILVNIISLPLHFRFTDADFTGAFGERTRLLSNLSIWYVAIINYTECLTLSFEPQTSSIHKMLL